MGATTMANASPYSWAEKPGGATGYPACPAKKRLKSRLCSERLRMVLVMRGCRPARPAAATRSFAKGCSSAMRSVIEPPISCSLRVFKEPFPPADSHAHDHVGDGCFELDGGSWNENDLCVLVQDVIVRCVDRNDEDHERPAERNAGCRKAWDTVSGQRLAS